MRNQLHGNSGGGTQRISITTSVVVRTEAIPVPSVYQTRAHRLAVPVSRTTTRTAELRPDPVTPHVSSKDVPPESFDAAISSQEGPLGRVSR